MRFREEYISETVRRELDAIRDKQLDDDTEVSDYSKLRKKVEEKPNIVRFCHKIRKFFR